MEIVKARRPVVRQESVGSPTASSQATSQDQLAPASRPRRLALRSASGGLQSPHAAEPPAAEEAHSPPVMQDEPQDPVRHRRQRLQEALKLPTLSEAGDGRARELARLFDPNIKSAGWHEQHGGAEAAGPYALGYWRAALRAAHAIRNIPGISLERVLRGLGQERQKLAIEAHSPEATAFGRFINPRHPRHGAIQIQTPISDKYLRLAHVQDFVSRLERNDVASYGDALTSFPFLKSRVFVFQEPMPDGHFMELSKIGPSVGFNFGDGRIAMSWMHASMRRHDLAHLETLFTAALQPSAPGLSPEAHLDDVCARVGKLHYFLAHFCPFDRGSAGISDMLTTALLYHHGYDHAGWKPNVSADVVALVTPSSAAFAKLYRGLMAPGPIHHP